MALSVAGGPWQDVRGFDGCAGVLSAEDGTVAVVTQWDDKPKVVIRPPGGAFGPVIALPCGAAWTAGPA